MAPRSYSALSLASFGLLIIVLIAAVLGSIFSMMDYFKEKSLENDIHHLKKQIAALPAAATLPDNFAAAVAAAAAAASPCIDV